MSDAQIIEIEFEASGETLELRDLNQNPCDKRGSHLAGLHIKSGTSAIVETNTHSDTGSVSFYAGREKIGVLNWDQNSVGSDRPIDWTPLSRNYSLMINADCNRTHNLAAVHLRISRSERGKRPTTILPASAGHMGFAGL